MCDICLWDLLMVMSMCIHLYKCLDFHHINVKEPIIIWHELFMKLRKIQYDGPRSVIPCKTFDGFQTLLFKRKLNFKILVIHVSIYHAITLKCITTESYDNMIIFFFLQVICLHAAILSVHTKHQRKAN